MLKKIEKFCTKKIKNKKIMRIVNEKYEKNYTEQFFLKGFES